ncbi:MAG: thiamine phosphate synthase, partial [Bacteroidetes bacterium]|nr:thiamine phosphate synthase [Bacteroidota bacterium]
LAEEACLAGVDWLQLRVKNEIFEEWLIIAKEVVAICKRHKVTVIINDNPEISKLSGADGVHLGKEDISPMEARILLGEKAIIGGTANSLEDVKNLTTQGVDYIGLGPFRFTKTKENLSPVLGIDGIKTILVAAKSTIPVVVIGAIKSSDLDEIISAGAHGVAVSSAINFAQDKEISVKEFHGQLELNYII